MPCHAAPVSGAFGGNILVRRCLVYAADMGLCLAQPSRTRQKLPRPRERESGVWSRNSDRSCRAQLHNIRPAVGSCHKEKITGRVQTTGPGEAWPRLSSVGIMAPNLTWDLIICEGLSVERWSPPLPTHSPEIRQEENGQQMVGQTQTQVSF